jgi:O-antigen ligase
MGVVGVKYLSPAAWKYLAEYYYTASGEGSMMGLSALATPHAGLFAIWSDIGAIGFLVYVSIYGYAIFHLLNNIRKRKYTNLYQLVLAESCVLWLVLLVGSNFMSDTFYRNELLGGLWICTALAWMPFQSNELSSAASSAKSR